MNVLLVSSSEGIALQASNILDLRGHRAHVFSIWHSAQEARVSRRCAGYVVNKVAGSSEGDRERFLAAVTAYCRDHGIDVIVPVGLWGTFVIAALQGRLPVAAYPTSDPDCIYQLHNKWTFYQDLQALELPTPSTSLIAPDEPLEAGGLRFPLVVKPLNKGGALGVRVCQTAADLAAIPAPRTHALLLQEWVPGVDGVFGALARDGELLCWTLHTKEEANLDFLADPRIETAARAIIRHAGFTGACNFDLRLSAGDGAYRFIECNPRIWASVGVSAWYGVDFIQAGLLVATGQPFPADLQTSVTTPRRLPNPDVTAYLRGMLRGAHPLISKASDLPWRMLTDPLPLICGRLRRNSVGLRIDDTDQVELARAADWHCREIADWSRPAGEPAAGPNEASLLSPRLAPEERHQRRVNNVQDRSPVGPAAGLAPSRGGQSTDPPSTGGPSPHSRFQEIGALGGVAVRSDRCRSESATPSSTPSATRRWCV